MDRHKTPPFALRLLYRTNAFHRPDELTGRHLPPYLDIHTWQDCTLMELAHWIAYPSREPPLLPKPAIGTRLAFRLMYPDTRNASQNSSTVRYLAKDLGSVVIGDGGPGLDLNYPEAKKAFEDTEPNKTLADARFVVGDYVSVAILPLLEDGSVAPASNARMGRGAGAGEARATVGRPPVTAGRGRDNGYGGRSARYRSGRGYDGFGRSEVPSGEWRRGESLPDAPMSGRGRDRY